MFSIIIGFGIAVAVFLATMLLVGVGLTHEEVFKKCGSESPYLAWIPLANYFELSVITRDEYNNNKFFGLNVPHKIFRFWFSIIGVFSIIPLIGSLLSIVYMVGCLGPCYQRLYAMVEQKSVKDTAVIGYLTGLIPIIAVFKFLPFVQEKGPSQFVSSNYGAVGMQQNMQQNYNQYQQQGYNQQDFNQYQQQGYNQQDFNQYQQQSFNQQDFGGLQQSDFEQQNYQQQSQGNFGNINFGNNTNDGQMNNSQPDFNDEF